MAYERRPLSLEPFEERTVPSASWHVSNPGNHLGWARAAEVRDMDAPGHALFTPAYSVWTGNFVTPDGSVVRVTLIFQTQFFVRFNPSAGSDDYSSDRRVTPEPKAPANTGNDDFPSGGDTRGIAQGPAKSVEPRSPATPAVVPPPDPTPPGQADGPTTGVAGAAPQVVAGQVGVPVAAQFLSGQIIALPTAGRVFGGESIDLSEAPPPVIPLAQTDEPPLAPPTIPEEPAAEPIIDVPAAAFLPAAGVLPVDLLTLGACATNFLDRVDSDVAWPDDMPSFEDYAWTAAALVLAGGAVYSMSGNRNGRPARRLVETGSALAEWEGKNVGRPY